MTRTPKKSSAPTSPLFAMFDALLAPQPVEIPGTAAPLYVKPLSAGDVRKITAASTRPGKSPDDPDGLDPEAFARALIAASICDAEGNPLIPDGDAGALDALPHTAFLALQSAVLRASGMGPDAAAEGATA